VKLSLLFKACYYLKSNMASVEQNIYFARLAE